tara:strand:- start:731 stop:1477 length:747 start_codon:yes stop_codon:yes gene_type:complete
MDIIEKVNKTRYTLKEILSTEWNTETITDYSNQEIEKMYSLPSSKDSVLGIATGCNFSIPHKMIPSHKLHIIYYNFPEIGRLSSKINKSCCDKIYNLYKGDLFNKEDSVFIIINEKITESLEKSVDELNINLQNELKESELNKTIIDEMRKNNFPLEKKHFGNVHMFNINGLTNNLLIHRLVPLHIPIRKMTDIKEILNKTNCTISQLPIILKNDAIAKLIRLSPGDICEIKRNSIKCGEYSFYRVCK